MTNSIAVMDQIQTERQATPVLDNYFAWRGWISAMDVNLRSSPLLPLENVPLKHNYSSLNVVNLNMVTVYKKTLCCKPQFDFERLLKTLLISPSLFECTDNYIAFLFICLSKSATALKCDPSALNVFFILLVFSQLPDDRPSKRTTVASGATIPADLATNALVLSKLKGIISAVAYILVRTSTSDICSMYLHKVASYSDMAIIPTTEISLLQCIIEHGTWDILYASIVHCHLFPLLLHMDWTQEPLLTLHPRLISRLFANLDIGDVQTILLNLTSYLYTVRVNDPIVAVYKYIHILGIHEMIQIKGLLTSNVLPYALINTPWYTGQVFPDIGVKLWWVICLTLEIKQPSLQLNDDIVNKFYLACQYLFGPLGISTSVLAEMQRPLSKKFAALNQVLIQLPMEKYDCIPRLCLAIKSATHEQGYKALGIPFVIVCLLGMLSSTSHDTFVLLDRYMNLVLMQTRPDYICAIKRTVQKLYAEPFGTCAAIHNKLHILPIIAKALLATDFPISNYTYNTHKWLNIIEALEVPQYAEKAEEVVRRKMISPPESYTTTVFANAPSKHFEHSTAFKSIVVIGMRQ